MRAGTARTVSAGARAGTDVAAGRARLTGVAVARRGGVARAGSCVGVGVPVGGAGGTGDGVAVGGVVGVGQGPGAGAASAGSASSARTSAYPSGTPHPVTPSQPGPGVATGWGVPD